MNQIFEPLDAEKGALLIEAVGSENFGPMLLEIASSISNVDELFGYLVKNDGPPEPIVSTSFLGGAEKRVESYLSRHYRHDYALHELSKIGVGQSFAKQIGLANVIPYDYRKKCFDQPGFTEKLSFGWRGKAYMLVLSFYRKDNSDQAALTKLASLANLTLATMVRFHVPARQDDIVATIERRMLRSFPELTTRERQVCARTLAGETASSIAAELGIGSGTVLTYRQRAYQRFAFKSCNDFLPLLIS
ncbi:helix-turn-helix transcriptional regulator [Parasphingorhabdus cellanae]|uniref:Helix-turn-helix transcriptional regulator n=1 Tax=Parasphingorhabdus cellanae TaxID=2806553 RepID=A0ABX7T5R0_9SPHN|nr:LuxR C-terminal-related transcriptional regulator [Parasphingorhabdus cellanae]QTD55847.1 helix-turn-helix transcriptional regulator [Parasphingorhabdus cellanae]